MQPSSIATTRISADASLTPRRQRRRQKRRQEILAVAMQMLLEGNLEDFSINGLARALDCSPATLYVYFSSREALLAELQALALKDAGSFYTRYANIVATYVNAQPANAKAKLAFQLQATGWVFERFSEDFPLHFRFLSQALLPPACGNLNNSAAIPVVVKAGESVLGLLAELFVQGVEHGLLIPGNAYERAIILWCGLQGLLQLKPMAPLYPKILHIDRLMEQQVCTLLKGWGAHDADLASAQNLKKEWKP